MLCVVNNYWVKKLGNKRKLGFECDATDPARMPRKLTPGGISHKNKESINA
jgi:hypothetical protein